MAVIIENMKLPDSCGKCYLLCKVGSYANPVYKCIVTGSIVDYTNNVTYKCNDCPLKEVSDTSVLKELVRKMEVGE